MSKHVQKIQHGMDPPPLLNTPIANWSHMPTAPQSVSIGSYPGDATAPDMTLDTFALDVVRSLTELKPVLKLIKHNVLTPYHPDILEQHLHNVGTLCHHEHIIIRLWVSFHLDFPNITNTQTPPNHTAIIEHTMVFMKSVYNEILKGRYIGPALKATIEALIGPFQASPMAIIPKPWRPDKYHILQNYSFSLISLTSCSQPLYQLIHEFKWLPNHMGHFYHHLTPSPMLITKLWTGHMRCIRGLLSWHHH